MPINLAVPALHENAPAVEIRPKQVQEWLDALPLANVGDAARRISDALATLNRTKVAEESRLKLLEQYRATIQALQPSLEEQYAGLALPLPEKNRALAICARQLQIELAYGYKIVLLDHLNKKLVLGQPKYLPLVLQRAIHALASILTACYQSYAPTPAGAWSELHQLYRYAVQHHVQDEELAHGALKVSINSTYKEALLLSLADPYHLLQGQVAHVLDYLARFAGQASLIPLLASAEQPVGFFLIRLDTDRPPKAIAQNVTATDPRTDILLNTVELARTLHYQLQKLEAGSEPGKLGLPDLARQLQYQEMMRGLIQHWGIAPKRFFNRVHKAAALEIVVGVRAIHHFLNPTLGARQTEVHDAEITLRLSNSAIDTSSQQSYISTSWLVLNESAGGMGMTKEPQSNVQVRVGEILGVRTDRSADWNIVIVRWVHSKDPGHLELGAQMLAPNATAVVLHPTLGAESNASIPGLLLPAIPSLNRPPMLTVTRGTYAPQREFKLTKSDGSSRIRAANLSSHTNSIEIFEYNETRGGDAEHT